MAQNNTCKNISRGGFPAAGLVLLAGLSHGAWAEERKSEVEALKQQVRALQETVKVLTEKVEQAGAAAASAQSQVETIVQTTPATQDDLQGVQSDLENFKWQWNRERETHTALSTRQTTIFGLVQPRYGWNELPVRSATVNRRENSFDIGTALIGFRGNLYRDYGEGRNLDYQVSFGASPQTGAASLSVLDAFVRYNVFPTINLEEPRLTLTLGQQLIPFGLEPAAPEDLKPVINNALWTRAANAAEFGRTGNGFLGLGLRQIGFIARGDLFPKVDWGSNYRGATLEWAAGVVNGSGSNISDDNSEKDYLGRLAFTVPADYNSLWRELKIGGSFYFGTQNRRVGSGTNTAFVSSGERNRFGLDFSYNRNPIGITYEWVRGFDGEAAGSTPAQPGLRNRESEAHTLTLFYNFGEQFVRAYRDKPKYDDWWPKSYQPFIRWDYFDPDIRRVGDDLAILTAGFNAFFAETTKLQLNYNSRFLASDHVPQDEFLLQIQYGF